MKRLTWGSITPVEMRDGRIKHRARAGPPDRVGLGLYDTREEAEVAIEVEHTARLAEERSRGKDATLGAFGRAWLDSEEMAGLRRAADRERSRWAAHIEPAAMAKWPITSITQRDVQRWMRSVLTSKARGPLGDGERLVSRETAKRALALLRSVFRGAIADGIIDTSPAEGIVVPRTTSTRETWTWLSQPEIDLVLGCEEISIRSGSIFAVAMFAGLRAGELFGLRWEDVLETELVVRYSRAAATKSGRVRRVPLLAPARDWLARWKRDGGRRTGLVWPADGGGHHHPGYDAGWADVLGRRAEERVRTESTAAPGEREVRPGAKARAGIEREVRFHDLRHTCASHLVSGTAWVERGWLHRALRLEEVREWLGHSTIAMTQRYAHLAPEAMRSAVVDPRDNPRDNGPAGGGSAAKGKR